MLKDLHELGVTLQNSYQTTFTQEDKELPVLFKQLVNNIEGSAVNYNRNSFVVTVNYSNQKIYFPNQLWYIAAYFADFYKALTEYAQIIKNKLHISDENIKKAKDNKEIASSLILHASVSDDDKEYLIRFLYDYNWWYGGKGIERADYYVSPILSLSKLVNASQSYVADLCKFLAKNEDALNVLKLVNEQREQDSQKSHFYLTTEISSYLPYLTALRTKPFMLLAGISGTGKSRIVREMAKACWAADEEDYGKNCPRNFCMVQVKPNWHDSSDLIGYVSRINGEKYVVGPFLRFIAKAIKDPKRPYFLCLDEMNLAPVEQYFAEYLSVIESRKLQDGHIETDPIVPYENTEAYGSLIDQLFDSDEERKAYKTAEGGKRLTIPENLFVVGTVNMDETTFSFSRKVLDRAMTIEMNEVDLKGGLEAGDSAEFGYIGEDLMGDAAEGKDIYADNQALCDDIITYLGKVNEILEGTPFKIAYRTRNEFLLYAVNRLHFATDSELWQTLDEMTSMKILSRIEGDNERCERVLREMKQLLTETVGEHAPDSVSLKKIDEMTLKLKSGYTSYWA